MTKAARLSALDALIEDLTVDAYNDEEQISGFLVAADEVLQRGETAMTVGVEVDVLEIDTGPDARTGLIARVRRDDTTYVVAFADLTFPAGSELEFIVAAYRRWLGHIA